MKLLTPEQWEAVETLHNADVNRLRLSHHGDRAMDSVITQIDCRQRASKKLGNTLKLAPKFMFPSTISAEQCTSDALASVHARLCSGSHRVLDMTCGLGIDTFHIARMAGHVTACEINDETSQCAVHNAQLLGLQNVEIKTADSEEYLSGLKTDSFDCIFIDPARRGAYGKRLYALSDCKPDVARILPRLLEIAPRVVIKASPMLDISHTLGELTNVTDIMALGDRRECKELVAVCQRGYDGNASIESITITGEDSLATFRFNIEEERKATPRAAIPAEYSWLYEPYPSVLKTGAFNVLATRYALEKMSANSHLYHSNERVDSFPGRIFHIKKIVPFNKKGIKEITTLLDKAEITTRNFPLSPEQLMSKLKIKSGGEKRIFATRTVNDKAILIITNQNVNELVP